MQLFVGLDVSQVSTHLCVVDPDGKPVWRGKCSTEPAVLAETIRARAGTAAKVGIETGPLTPWLVHSLRASGLDVVCIEARHAHAVMSAAQVNKNDRNDAKALAQLLRMGWYRAVTREVVQRASASGGSRRPRATRDDDDAHLQPHPRGHEDLRSDCRERHKDDIRHQS